MRDQGLKEESFYFLPLCDVDAALTLPLSQGTRSNPVCPFIVSKDRT